MKFKLLHIAISIFAFLSQPVIAQDIEQIAKAPIIATNGGFSFSQIGTFTDDTNSQVNPYAYYLAGNLNSNLFGVVSLPVSFAYTNNQATSNLPQPFNRLSLSPSYKWITAHIGYSSMTFSPYTLTGHEFLGGGVDLTPNESLRISAMYGRLRKAVPPDSMNTEPFYRRLGGGFKVEYKHEKIDLGVNLFKAKDDVNSLEPQDIDSILVKPQDNLSGSLFLNLKLINNFSLTGEYGISAINQNIGFTDSLYTDKFTDIFLEGGGDIAVYHAFKVSAAQTSSIGKIGATYERVGPNYNTLGAYYFTNDFENITANFSTSIKDWLNIGLDVGYQHDDLLNQKTNSSSRMIYSANVSARATKRLNLSAAFSNLQTYVHIRDVYTDVTQTNQYQNLDTLSFTQLNLTQTLNANYVLQSSKERRQSINGGFTYQEASEQQTDDQQFTGNKIYNSMLSYQFSMIPQRLNISTSVNHNHNRMPETVMNVMSYNLSIQKTFLEKFKTALISTYSNTNPGEVNTFSIINIRATAGYLILKKHSINLSMAMVNKEGIQGKSTQYSINLAYNYVFNFNVTREEKNLGFTGNF